MQRIQGFLREPDIPEWASSLNTSDTVYPDITRGIGFDQATFEWDVVPRTADGISTPPARFQLGPINLAFPEGKITLVTGATGSGKSALLSALLGEMHCVSGRVRINKAHHEVAYCGQNPWLEHATIRNNIIFGARHGYDEERYKAVIEACALARDLEIFEAGDQTGQPREHINTLVIPHNFIRNRGERHNTFWRPEGTHRFSPRIIFGSSGYYVGRPVGLFASLIYC